MSGNLRRGNPALDLNDLLVFVRAAETCNFSAAARRLHMTQPAVSLRIRELESHLRTQLFERRGPSVMLSEAGQALLPMARALLSDASRVEESIACRQGDVVGNLTIACSTTSGKYLLPHLIAAFRRRHPQVRAQVLVTHRQSALSRVLAGNAHLAVTSSRVEHRELEYQPFFVDQIVLIVPRGHPWADRRTIRPEDLLEEEIILREESSGTRRVLLDGLGGHGIHLDDLRVAMELGNAEAIEVSVEAGLGVAFVSMLAAAKGIELGQVRVVDVAGLRLSRPILLARGNQRPATRAQTAFWEFVGSEENAEFLRTAPAGPLSLALGGSS